MKLKLFFAILVLSLSAVAQTAAPTTPAPDAKTCACCNHDKAESGAKATCCKDGKCPMMSGKHEAMKCPMMAKNGKMADGKMCCSSNKCPMHGKDGKSCCGNMGEHQPSGI
jgi:hypothetical protein